MTQITPIRDPAITIAPTIGPIINTIGTIAPVRTIVPIRTISSENVVINRTTSTLPFTSSTSTFTDINNDAEIAENGDNLTLVYALVPTGILALILVLLCVRRKRAINNNNVVNIDLNIENVLPNDNAVIKQTSVNSARFSSHIYEEVDYESRYEMPSIGVSDTPNYENVFNSDNEYGKQVTTIV
tara:strand:- start:136 stop:690 length:555 start_codon:yes stop_codon:yes gene_type:complete